MTEQASALRRRIADGLYLEAMLLADEARAYFEDGGQGDRDGLGACARVAFSCESLRVTTRLMHVLAFLLTRKAVDAGELTPEQALAPSRRLGEMPPLDGVAVARLPARAADLAARSAALHRRTAVFEEGLAAVPPAASPVSALQARLAALV